MMFGSDYSNNLEILSQSFRDMNDEYKLKFHQKRKGKLFEIVEKVYIKTFGIPEIGLQIRHLYFDKVIHVYLKRRTFKPLTILDAGCGIGVYTLMLSKYFPGSKILGTDIDKNKLAFCRKFFKRRGKKSIDIKYEDVTKKNVKLNEFDFIVHIDVLEHVHDYKQVIKNFYARLKPDGYLFIHTPQVNQRRIFKRFADWHHEDHMHEGFSPKKLKSDLEKQGYKVIALYQTIGTFGRLAWELNHILLSKSFVLAGISYPFLYFLAILDVMKKNTSGLGIALLAQKK